MLSRTAEATPVDSIVDQSHPRDITHPKYRADIDGLRAIAVISVVVYHAFPKALRGGFIGVDVFFVISGFLISTIIFGSLNRGAFSFTEFYGRRIKRIFPALSIVLIASLVFGRFYLLSGEFKLLGKHIAGGAGFVSNVILWSESGYFDNAANTKPLLHLWSLGIEEQFYIVWPLLLCLAWKWRLNLLTISIAIALASFSLNIHTVASDVVADFYSPLTRFWELMLGSILANAQLHHEAARSRARLQLSNWLNRIVYSRPPEQNDSVLADIESLFGFTLIIVGILIVNGNSKFPGWLALLPAFGAVLIISAGPRAWVNRYVLSSPTMVWAGLISFPLYLWHWPLLSFSRIMQGDTPNVVHKLAALGIAVALSWLTFTLVEKPIRRNKYGKTVITFLVIIMAIVGCLGYTIYTRDGLSSCEWVKSNEEVLSKLQRVTQLGNISSCFELPQEKSTAWFTDNGCLIVRFPDRPKVLLIGDSHSASLSLGLRPLVEQRNVNFLQMSSGWCPPFSNIDTEAQCRDMNKFVVEQIVALRPDVLVIDCHWFHDSDPEFFTGGDFVGYLKEKFVYLKSSGVKKMIVVGQIPTWTAGLPDILARRFVLRNLPVPTRTFVDIEPASFRMDREMKQMLYPADVSYLSLKDGLCNESGCLTSVGPNLDTDLLVWDYGHLTRAGSTFVSETILKKPLLDALGIRN